MRETPSTTSTWRLSRVFFLFSFPEEQEKKKKKKKRRRGRKKIPLSHPEHAGRVVDERAHRVDAADHAHPLSHRVPRVARHRAAAGIRAVAGIGGLVHGVEDRVGEVEAREEGLGVARGGAGEPGARRER